MKPLFFRFKLMKFHFYLSKFLQFQEGRISAQLSWLLWCPVPISSSTHAPALGESQDYTGKQRWCRLSRSVPTLRYRFLISFVIVHTDSEWYVEWPLWIRLAPNLTISKKFILVFIMFDLWGASLFNYSLNSHLSLIVWSNAVKSTISLTFSLDVWKPF